MTDNTQYTHALIFLLRLLLVLLLPLALLWLYQPAIAVGLLWDWANSLGYLASAGLLLLFIYAGRAKASPPFNGRFFYNIHRDLGVLVVVLSALHIGVLLYHEPLLLEHLKITAPWSMLAGLLALLLLLILGLLSGHWARLKLWPAYRLFQNVHLWLSALALACLAWHIAGAHFYINHWFKQLALVLLLIVVLLVFYRQRHRNSHISGAKMAVANVSPVLVVALFLLSLLASWYLVVMVGAYES